MKPLILSLVLLMLVTPIVAQPWADADRYARDLESRNGKDGPSRDWTKGTPNNDLTRAFEIISPENSGGREYDPSKGPVCEKDANGLCKDTALPVGKNPDLTTIASREEVAQLIKIHGNRIDTPNGACVNDITKSVFNTIVVLLSANKEVFVTSVLRDKNHPLERTKRNGPGRHTEPNAPVDIAPVNKNGNPTGSWRVKNYSREKTQAIVDLTMVMQPRRVCLYNDSEIIGCHPWPKHDSHMHFDFGDDDLSPVAKEFLRTKDPTAILAAVAELQKERLEPGGIERQRARYEEVVKQRHQERICAKLTEKQNFRYEAEKEKFKKACYEAWLREAQNRSQQGNGNDHSSHEIYGDTH